MNVYEIEALVRSADQLRNYEKDSKGDKVHELLLDRVSAELGKVKTSDEVAALQASSNIKQANLNLLAGKSLEVSELMRSAVLSSYPNSLTASLKELETLAKNLIQEEPNGGVPG